MKITRVVRNMASGIRVEFDDNKIPLDSLITNNKKLGTQYIVSNKQGNIFDLLPIHEQGVIPDNSSIKEGTEFVIYNIAIGEFDTILLDGTN